MMVLDVKTILNNNRVVNLELQVLNARNWPERSLSYLCRCFDNIEKGNGYDSVKGAFHIGFLDYTLFPDDPSFFASYKIANTVTNHLYTSKFGISVIDLTLIDMATDEDKILHRHLWASFFKATTWEEINMLAAQDKNIQQAATKLYELSEDKRVRDEIWAREDAIRCRIDFENYWKREIANRDDTIAVQNSTIAEKDSIIANLMAEIEQLKAGK